MLAGRIKLKTFLIITLPVVGVLGLGALYVVQRAGMAVMDKAAEAERVDREAFHELAMKRLEEEKKEAQSAPAPASTETPAAVDASRPWDTFLLARQGKDLGTKKIKDAAHGKPYKINLYQDAGHGTINRAKVDIDRDERWDEKWTFDDGRLSRKVSPADDEDYTQVWVWDGGAWARD